jgi:uncharacterized protein DUF4270
MPIMIFMTKYYHSSRFPSRSTSVHNYSLKIFHLSLVLFGLLLISSCEEDPTNIGSELLPESDNINVKSIDTLSVWSYRVYDDSIKTDEPLVSFLGEAYDPYFGTTTAEFVTEIRMISQWIYEGVTVDSVSLHLNILSVKGGSSVTHTLRLSEIAEKLDIDSDYYSNSQVDTTDFSINIELPILKPDSVNQIELALPVEFANYLLRDTLQLFYSNTQDDFRSFFKGLYFRISSSVDPLLVALNLQPLTASDTYNNYFIIWMHDKYDIAREFQFAIDATNTNASFSRFSHNFNTALPENKIEHINDYNNTETDTLSYVQSLNGIYTKVVFPGLEDLKNDPSFDNIAVNKARLIVPIYFDDDYFKPSTVPSSLRIRYSTASGDKFDVPDYDLDESHGFFDGVIDSINNVYNFNLATYIQAYLDDTTGDLKPELEIYQSLTETYNLILKANRSKTPVKFEFTYSKF